MRWLRSLRDRLRPPTWRDHARRRGLTPVVSDWERLYAIDPHGRPVESESVEWRDLREVTDPAMRHLVLAQAAIRHPELAHLRPARRPDDPDCDTCGGTGMRKNQPRMICRCGGTGWLPIDLQSIDEAP